ncbi:MAG: hypothetical protein P4M11_12905 [Candidatus Pacebacteria bacterium]|nr:hypothetical protein [Candidatus Paceibacterota bacterium]
MLDKLRPKAEDPTRRELRKIVKEEPKYQFMQQAEASLWRPSLSCGGRSINSYPLPFYGPQVTSPKPSMRYLPSNISPDISQIPSMQSLAGKAISDSRELLLEGEGKGAELRRDELVEEAK